MADRPCVLLLSPGIIKWTDMDFGLPHLVSIGGYLLESIGESRIRVEILDVGYEGGDHAHLERTLAALTPFLCIGISCYSSFDYLRVMALARFLRRLYPSVPLITGGYHASALPHDMVFDGSPFDAVLPGEAERSMAVVVEHLLGGGRIEAPIVKHETIENLDDLPLQRWDLLKRYWPRAQDIGRKFQISLSRGCPYRCTFCMERAKGGYTWRAFSAERALDELSHLATFTDLSPWVVNIADPLFGLKRSWRRQVLTGIVDRKLFPRQYWTLTRSDDLNEEDVELFARARFSIGIGMESGSPRMLDIMQKGNRPEAYLGALERLAGLSVKHGLNWAANIIIGHPGEDEASMRETLEVVTRLFTAGGETCGWLSIDPFRLYPGALIHEELDTWSRTHGTTFHHPEWWKSWYDGPFRAEHVDPSTTLDFAGRVRFMYQHYPPLVKTILDRFRGQDRSVDRVFQRSLAEQVRLMSPEARDDLIRRGERARAEVGPNREPVVHFPVGLNVRNPLTRLREAAVKRLLETGALRTEALVEALLAVPPERYLGEADAEAMLSGVLPKVEREGDPPAWIGFSAFALALEALNPGAGERVADLLAVRGYVAAVLSHAVGEAGEVIALHPGGRISAFRLRAALSAASNIEVVGSTPLDVRGLSGPFDGLWLGAALPRFPKPIEKLLADSGGRAATLLGPRFRPQDLVCLTRRGGTLHERIIARLQVPILAAPGGWTAAPAP